MSDTVKYSIKTLRGFNLAVYVRWIHKTSVNHSLNAIHLPIHKNTSITVRIAKHKLVLARPRLLDCSASAAIGETRPRRPRLWASGPKTPEDQSRNCTRTITSQPRRHQSTTHVSENKMHTRETLPCATYMHFYTGTKDLSSRRAPTLRTVGPDNRTQARRQRALSEHHSLYSVPLGAS